MWETQVLENDSSTNEESQSDDLEVIGFVIEGQKKHEVKKGCNKIGRDPEVCSIVLDSDAVSKLHFVIDSEGIDDTFIYDVGSTNRTKLGKRYLKPHCRYKLEYGSTITLGSMVLYFTTPFCTSRIYCPPQPPSKIISNLGDEISIFDNIFSLETQVNITQPRVGNNAISHTAAVNCVEALQPGTSNRLEHENSCGNYQGCKLSVVENDHSKINDRKKISQNLFHLNLPQQNENNLLNYFENCNTVNAETQCQNQLPSSKKSLEENIMFKDDKQVARRLTLNNCQNEIVCDATPNFSSEKRITVLENDNAKASSAHSQEKSSCELAEIIQGYINTGNEKELSSKAIKFSENSKESSSFKYNIEGQNINWESKNSSVADAKKTVNNDITPEINLHCSASDKNKIENASNFNSVNQISLNRDSCKENLLKNFDLNNVTNILFPIANNITTNCQLKELNICQKDLPVEIVNDTCQQRVHKIESKKKITPQLFKEDSMSDTESYLEITIGSIVEEKINNPVSTQSNVNEETIKNSFSRHIGELNESQKQSSRIFQAQCENNIETKSECLGSPGNVNDFFDSSKHKERLEMDALEKIIRCPGSDSYVSQHFTDEKTNNGESNDVRFLQKSSSESSLETDYFNRIKRRHSKLECWFDSESVEETPIQDLRKHTQETTMRNKDFSSFVLESSDEDDTISDLEVIENTPNVKCSKNAFVNTMFKTKPVTDWINPIESPKFENFYLDCSDDSSNSSYVFEIGNEENDKNDLEKRNQDDNKIVEIISDSDKDDIIDSTPQTKSVAIKSCSFAELSSGNKTEVLKPPINSHKSNAINLLKRFDGNRTTPAKFFWASKAGLSPEKIHNTWMVEETSTQTVEEINYTSETKNELPRRATTETKPRKMCDSLILLEESESFQNQIPDDVPRKKIRIENNFSNNIPEEKSRTDDERRFDLEMDFSDPLSKSDEEQLLSMEKNRDEIQSKIKCGMTAPKNQPVVSNFFLQNKRRNESEKSPGKSRNGNNGANAKENIKNPDGVSNKNYQCKKSLFGKRNTLFVRSEENHLELKSSHYPETTIGNASVLKNLEEHNRPKRKPRAENSTDDESYFENHPVTVVFTGLYSQTLDKMVDKLGGKKADDLRSSQVLVTDKFRRTTKLLCAIGLSMPITSPDWLLQSTRKKKFLNPWNHILKCEESEKKWNFDLKATLEKAKEKKLLDGFSIFATKNIKPPVEDILLIAECCGGIPLRDRPKIWSENTIVVSCLEDEKFWPPRKYRSVKIVHFEFIFGGVLRQELDFKTYVLR